MKIKLEQIAQIRTGYTLREGLDKMSPGETRLIQMSHIEALKEGTIDSLKTINMKIRTPDWTVQEGDLLMKARGTEFIPVVIQKVLEGAVFTHPLLRIRIDRNQAVPEFIAWLISQANVQVQFQRLIAGTSLQTLKLEHLKALEIDLPPLHQQAKVKEIVQLMQQEQTLLSLIMSKRNRFISYSVEMLMQKEHVESAK